MENPIPTAISLLLFLLLSSATNSTPVASKQKTSHFQFYWHDIVSGPNPTSIKVAAAPSSKTSSTLFGTMIMIDDPLTTGPDLKSKLIGRAQGLYAMAGRTKLEATMAMNLVFSDGKYNGSTIAVLGHNAVSDLVREMPIVGGSGRFRFAQGYVQARTYSFDKSGDAVVEYNVFVNHY